MPGNAHPVGTSNIGKEIDTTEVAGTTSPAKTGDIEKRTCADETATSVETAGNTNKRTGVSGEEAGISITTETGNINKRTGIADEAAGTVTPAVTGNIDKRTSATDEVAKTNNIERGAATAEVARTITLNRNLQLWR